MQTRKDFLVTTLAAVAAGGAFGKTADGDVKLMTDGKRPLVTVRKGLDGGKVLCLSNRSHSQMSSTVFVSPKGRVAVVDGGAYADGDNLQTVLQALGGKVDCWFVTHAHEDHYGALVSMLERHSDLGGISVGKLCYTFPETDWTGPRRAAERTSRAAIPGGACEGPASAEGPVALKGHELRAGRGLDDSRPQ